MRPFLEMPVTTERSPNAAGSAILPLEPWETDSAETTPRATPARSQRWVNAQTALRSNNGIRVGDGASKGAPRASPNRCGISAPWSEGDRATRAPSRRTPSHPQPSQLRRLLGTP